MEKYYIRTRSSIERVGYVQYESSDKTILVGTFIDINKIKINEIFVTLVLQETSRPFDDFDYSITNRNENNGIFIYDRMFFERDSERTYPYEYLYIIETDKISLWELI